MPTPGWNPPRGLLAAALAALALLGPPPRAAEPAATAADPVVPLIAGRVADRTGRPSVHDDRLSLERSLAAAGLPAGTIARLFADVAQAEIPGAVGSLDAFLFLTRDPEWLAVRGQFNEFLELPGVTALDADRAKPLDAYGGVITFPAITSLTPETAAALAGLGSGDWGAAVEFPAVATLGAEAAAAIAGYQGLLVFPGLRELGPAAARGLARHEGIGIALGGLNSLPPDVAKALAETRSLQGLLLPDLERLDSPALAARLARQDHVFLPRVTVLDPAVAAALRGNEGGELALPRLEQVTVELARQLLDSGYYTLRLGAAGSLSAEAATILAGHRGSLEFVGPASFSPAAAAALATNEGVISLPHVAALPLDVARALAPHEGGLVLAGMTSLTPELATALAAHAGAVILPGIETLTPDVAAVLAARTDSLVLSGLKRLDAATAAAFAAHARETLVIGGIDELSPEAAAALATHRGRLALPAVTSLSPQAAAALAAHPGALALESVAEVSAEVAAELARHEGDLELSAIRSLSTEAARALAAAPGRLALPNLVRLTPEGAAALAGRRAGSLSLYALQFVERIDSVPLAELLVKAREDLELHDLQALEGPRATAIARVLAGTRGILSLPALERVAPRALEALLAKPGVSLPPLETLELVAEPGVKVSDDLVYPEP